MFEMMLLLMKQREHLYDALDRNPTNAEVLQATAICELAIAALQTAIAAQN